MTFSKHIVHVLLPIVNLFSSRITYKILKLRQNTNDKKLKTYFLDSWSSLRNLDTRSNTFSVWDCPSCPSCICAMGRIGQSWYGHEQALRVQLSRNDAFL